MDSRFKNIDEEKRDKIINAALAEFGKNGYNKASTNEIVKNAGISRGLLYHYFKDKKELYEVLTDYSINLLIQKVNDAIDWDESDILERLKQITFAKIELSSIYPDLFNFVLYFFTKENKVDTLEAAYEVYKKLGIDIKELFTKVYQHNIDYSKFREPENIKIHMDIIRWTIEKWTEEALQNSGDDFTADDMVKFGEQINEYTDALKKAFY